MPVGCSRLPISSNRSPRCSLALRSPSYSVDLMRWWMMCLSEMRPRSSRGRSCSPVPALLLAGWFLTRRESRQLRILRDRQYRRFLVFLAQVRSASN